MKKIFLILGSLLLVAALVVCALFGLVGRYGQPSVDAAAVSAIRITDHLVTGEQTLIRDPHQIAQITAVVNDLSPALGMPDDKEGSVCSLSFLDEAGKSLSEITIVDARQISMDGYFYPASAQALLEYLTDLMP